VTDRDCGLERYPWSYTGSGCAHDYLLPKLDDILNDFEEWLPGRRILDLGCGNGAVTAWLAERGGTSEVVGVEPSHEGIERARSAYPSIEFHQASAYDPLREQLGTFSLVVSLEVVEHVYDPTAFVHTVYEVVEPGGLAVISTPYHGWLKNLAIALLGRFDDHVNPLRVHGHIKFWSRATLSRLLEEAGLEVLEFRYAGRIRPLAKSMLAVARRPVRDAEGPETESVDVLRG